MSPTVPKSRRRVLAVMSLALTLGAGVGLATPFTYHDYDGVVAELEALAAAYPDLAELDTAQSLFGLASIPDGEVNLPTYVFRITNESSGLDKPEVLLVGVQHGDEIVSAEVALVLARLLLESYGVDPWLTALVDRREIYFVPLANPWGFRHGTRSGPGNEGFEDMNRDHVYDRDPCGFGCQDAESVSTVGARAIHELSRRHLFRVMLDYHGGIELILHPWGTPLHVPNSISPDHSGHDALGQRMRDFGGPFSGFYPVGTSNDLLGALHGPLDDTAYASTWDPANADPGWPTVGAGALSYTIEISNDKSPPQSQLGGDADLLTPGGLEDGYVPKNVRIGLAAIDIAEPWVDWANRDQIPSQILDGGTIDLEWQVRGCFEIDDTRARFGTDPDPVTTFDGQTAAQIQVTGSPCFGTPTLFGAQVTFPGPGTYYVSPVARVDGVLLDQNGENPPGTVPQSWLVRNRTEEGLVALNDTDPGEINTLQGRLYWGAEPLMVEVVALEIFTDGFESGGLAAWSGQAGSLEVNADAAFTGALGLEASLEGCALPDQLTVDSPTAIVGTFEACSSVTGGAVEVIGPTEFRAGDWIQLDSGFTVSAPFTAVIDAGLGPFPWVADDTPDQETSYHASFRLNLDPLTVGGGDRLVLLEGADGPMQFQLYLRRDTTAMENRLGLVAREAGGLVETVVAQEVVVPAGWNLIEADWRAGAGDGHATVSVNGGGAGGLSGLDNELSRIDRVRLGVVDGAIGGSAGSIWFDDFSSFR